jgi:hypothetical protein
MFEGRLFTKLTTSLGNVKASDFIGDLVTLFEDGKVLAYDKFTESSIYLRIGSIDLTVSGLLNATVANAVYVEGGEVKHPVKGVVITGDVYELLKTDEVVLTSNKEVLGRYEVPAIYIPKISVAGEG